MDLRTAKFRIAKLIVIAALLTPMTAAGAGRRPIKIGVLAKRGVTQCIDKWGPTAEYLSTAVSPYTFKIIPLDFAAVPRVVAQKSVDFILTNSSSYVELENRYHISAIATLINRLPCGDHTVFGGVVFCRADDPNIKELNDLRGRDFIAVEQASLGGWRMALREFLRGGIDPRRDFKSLAFGGTHDAVVYAVQNHRADAGTVRTDTLERMASEGKIDLASFRILNPRPMGHDRYGFLCSTRLYPEWPLAKLAHTPIRLSELVTHAMLRMTADNPAAKAAKCAGWTHPLSYHPIHECLQEIQMGPYDPSALNSLKTVCRRYRPWMVATGIAWAAIMLSAVFIIRLNTRLASANTNLRSEIEKRKKTETALETALETSQEANMAKTQFLANMSHELRTPMNGIIGMTRVLLDSPLNEEQLEFARTISTSSQGLLHLINDILDFSKIEKGRLKLEAENFQPAAAIQGIAEIFHTRAGEKGLAFNYMVNERVPPYLRGDANRLKQIIENLLDNAVKFTHRGEVFLHVGLDKANHTECILRITVRDTGIGIPPERIEHIFSSFYQLDGSFSRQHGGTGLGLALSKHLVEMMGGRIGVESEPQNGSVFWFTAKLALQKTAPGLEPFEVTDINGKRILVVEDNIVNQKIIMKLLGSRGYRVRAADDGRKAVTELRRHVYDVVLMDLQMPEMNGFEAAAAIRNPENGCLDPNVPIIAVTANTSEADRLQCLDAGMDDYLPKPVNPKELFEKIHLWHEKRRICKASEGQLFN